MNEPQVSIATNNHIRTVRLARPDKRNALSRDMLDCLIVALSNVEDDVRALVLAADGPVFCAGLDLAERQRSTAGHSGESLIEPALDALTACPVPVVAAVHGHALAGGCELALACDLVIAAADAEFGMPLASAGLAATWGLTHRLLDVGGLVFTRQLLLGGRRFNGAELAQNGVVSEAVPAAEVSGRVNRLTSEMAGSAPLSLRAMKAAIQRSLHFRAGIEHADVDALSAGARNSRDATEGVAARLERRTPIFEGR